GPRLLGAPIGRLIDLRFVILLPLVLCSSYVPRILHSFPTRRSSDLFGLGGGVGLFGGGFAGELRLELGGGGGGSGGGGGIFRGRSEEHTSELQSRENLVCRLLLEKKNTRRARRMRLYQQPQRRLAHR